jgi:hypothetical protein
MEGTDGGTKKGEMKAGSRQMEVGEETSVGIIKGTDEVRGGDR